MTTYHSPDGTRSMELADTDSVRIHILTSAGWAPKKPKTVDVEIASAASALRTSTVEPVNSEEPVQISKASGGFPEVGGKPIVPDDFVSFAGADVAENLRKMDIHTIQQIADAKPAFLIEACGGDKARAKALNEKAKRAVRPEKE